MSTQHASGHHLNVSLGDGLWVALHDLADRTGESVSHIVRRSLADTKRTEPHVAPGAYNDFENRSIIGKCKASHNPRLPGFASSAPQRALLDV